MSRLATTSFSSLICLVLLVLGSGCGQQAYVVEQFEVTRSGWDTLQVDVSFAQQSVFGGPKSGDPTSLAVYLFNAAYDTLYASNTLTVPLEDHNLGDREGLMVEVCGTFSSMTVCEQTAIDASPKRIRLEHEIEFPEDTEYEKGRYDLSFVVERQIYDSEDWERIRPRSRVTGYLLAYVGDTSEGAIKVPFSRPSGKFNLTRYEHYKDFQYHLKSQFLDAREANVYFDVYTVLNGQPPFRLASIEKHYRQKTHDEHVVDVWFFTEQTAQRILEWLGVKERDRNARAYIDNWDYNRLTKSYEIETEIEWRTGGRLLGRRYHITGILNVKEDGTGAKFQFKYGSRHAGRYWRSRIGQEVLILEPLDPYQPDETEEEVVPSTSTAQTTATLPSQADPTTPSRNRQANW